MHTYAGRMREQSKQRNDCISVLMRFDCPCSRMGCVLTTVFTKLCICYSGALGFSQVGVNGLQNWLYIFTLSLEGEIVVLYFNLS